MTVYERQNTILNFLKQQRFATIKELSKIGLKYTFTVCNKDEIDEIICDKKLPWE